MSGCRKNLADPITNNVLKEKMNKEGIRPKKRRCSVQKSGNFGALAGSSILEIAGRRAIHRSAAFICVL